MFRKSAQRRVLFGRTLVLPLLAVFAVGLILFLAILAPSHPASAATNSTINFQARLLTASGSIVPDGTYNVEFKLYNALTSSGSSQGSCTGDAACLWTETRTTTNKVTVKGGYLTVSLGSVTAFPSTINWDQDVYLTMNIGGTGSAVWDGEMNPRIHLTAIPYAFRAGSLASLSTGGFTSTLSFATGIGQNSTITLPDPGGSSATVCYQAATACGFMVGSGTAFVQGGNSFSGTTAGSLGTLNNGNLNFLTNNGTRLTLDTSGNLQFQQASTVNIAAATTGTQLTVKGGDATSGTNAGGNLLLQGGAGASTGASGSVIVKSNTNNSASAFVVQNAGGNQVLTVDTSGNQVLLGKPGASGVNGQLAFNNATNANIITLVSGATAGSYSLTLPTAGPGTSQCLQTDSVTASQLRFASCSAGGDLQAAYVASGTPATITTTSSSKTILLKAGTGFDSTSLFQIQNAASAAVMTVDSTNSQVLLQGTNTTAILGPNLFTGSPICTGTGWTGSDPTWTHTNGGGTSDLDCTPPSSITFGETYQVSFNVTGLSGGDILTANIGGNPGSTVTENGSYVQVISANNSSLAMFFVNNSSSVAQITGIQIQLITPANNILAIQNSIGTNGIEIRSGGDGLGNSFVGFQSGEFTTGGQDTALGNIALAHNTSGGQNTALGYAALYLNSSGGGNTAIGTSALFSNTVGNNNTAVGYNSLDHNTIGSQNQAFGLQALIDNTSGNDNTALGSFALESNLTGGENIAVGQALAANLTGNQNAAIGNGALGGNTTGNNNVALGYFSLNNNNGDSNVGIGYQALHGGSATTYSDNIGIGSQALFDTTGSSNVAIGSMALVSQTSGTNNTVLGYHAGYQDPNNTNFATPGNLTNATAIGYGAQVLNSNSLVLGAVGSVASNLTPNVGIGTESPTNLLSVSPDVSDAFGACQGANSSCNTNGNQVFGFTTWTPAMVGDEIIFANGDKKIITAYVSATQVTVDGAATQEAAQSYRIHQPALQVTSAGNVGIGTVAPTANLQVTTQTNTTTAFQIQNAASAAVMTVDSTNSQVLLQGTNTTAILGPNLFTGSPICTGTGWTGSDPTWTHTNGGGTSDLDCTPPSSITFGETYQVSFNVTGLSGGDILTANIGGNPGSTVTENGSYVQVISANNSSLAMFFVNNSSSVAQITGIQIQLITPANNILAIQNSIGTNGIEIRSGGDGLFNTFVGFQSGRFATGDGNTALGNSALATDTSGTSNTAIGANALKFNTSGSWNIAIGAGSLFNNSIGNQNTAVGFNALNNNNVGSDNAAFGYFALIDNTTGSGNTALGGFNLESNTTGSDSTAVGNGALSSNLTGNQNVALGTNTLNSNTTGSDNVALGYLSLNDNNGDNNVSLGAFSLHGNSSTTFSDNIGIGASSLYNNTGDRNVGIGSRALQDQTSGSNNTALGYYAGYQDPNNTSFATLGNLTNVTVLGYGAQALSSNSLVLGAVGNTSGNLTPNVGIGTESPTNLLSVSPNVYDTGSICQGSSSCTANSTTITGGGTNFTAAMVGDEIVFNDGTKDTITAFIDATHVTVTTSRTHAFSAYRIHQPALQVTSTGNVGIGTVSPTANLQVTTQTNTTTAFVIQNASAVSLLTADTTNGRLVIGSGSAGETAGQILVLDSDSDATITNGGSNNTSAEVDGALFYSSTSHSFVCGESGVWMGCLGGLRDSSTAPATAITAATDTNFSGGTGNTYTIPANDCVVGRVYRVQAYGVYSSATAARNITFKLKFGSTVLAASGGIQTVAGAANRGWSLTANITCITTGATGSVEAQGQVVVNNSTTGVTSNVGDMPNSAAIGSINTTAGQTLQLSAGWDATTNAPTITMRSFVVEGIGP